MHPRTRYKAKKDELTLRRQLVFEHKRSGGMLDEEFSEWLVSEYNIAKNGQPYAVSTLKKDYDAFMEERAAEYRENFSEYQLLLLERHERNLARLNDLLDNGELNGGNYIKALTEIRNTNQAIATLLGANAPIETIVHHELNGQIEFIFNLLKTRASETAYQELATILHEGLGLSHQHVIEAEKQQLQSVAKIPGLDKT